jgi:hypothetical protein
MRSALAAVVLAAAAIAVAGCTSRKMVDSSQVEKGIKSSLSSTAEVKSAKCPDGVKSQKGAAFTCDVTFTSGASGKVEVTEVDRKTFTYTLKPGSVEIPGSEADKQIEAALADHGIQGAAASCPDSIVVKTGTLVTCDVTGADSAGQVTFSFSATDGTIDPSSVKTT